MKRRGASATLEILCRVLFLPLNIRGIPNGVARTRIYDGLHGWEATWDRLNAYGPDDDGLERVRVVVGDHVSHLRVGEQIQLREGLQLLAVGVVEAYEQ